MNKNITHSSFFRFTYLKLIILAGILSFNSVCVNATITLGGVQNIKLTSATLTVTITPNGSIVDSLGVMWSTTSGSYNDSIKLGSTPGGLFTVEMTGLDRSKTIYYKVYSKEGSNTEYSTESSFSNVPIFNINETGNWDDATKWNVREIPGTDGTDSPIIDGICTIVTNPLTGNWICNNLTIIPGARLTINPGQALNVSGVLTNNAAAGLVIKSDGISANGTLTFNNDQLNPVSATVEMYSKASWDLDQFKGSKYSWQFFGIPVKTHSFDKSTFDNCLVRKYNESSIDDLSLWTAQSEANTLTACTGYEIVQQDPKTYTFTGTLNNENFNPTMNYIPGAKYPGQHIFSNPYTAAIDIDQIDFTDNAVESVYLYNTGTYNDWFGSTGTIGDGKIIVPGQYMVSTPNSVDVLGIPAQIPGMQGFLVRNLLPANGSIKIPYLTSTINNAMLQRATGLKKEENAAKIVTRIDLSGTHPADCMWIFTDPTCTTNFDNGWDGKKMMGSVLSPQLFAMESDGDYQIDAVSDINGTYLGFNAAQDTNYKLTFTHQNAGVRYSGLYLVDLVENKTIDITASGSEYAFNAVSTPSPVKRFKLITSPEVNTNIPAVSSMFKIINSNGTLVIQNQSIQNGILTLYTLNGVVIGKIACKANAITTFSTSSLLPGAYVAKASTDREMVTERIIIR